MEEGKQTQSAKLSTTVVLMSGRSRLPRLALATLLHVLFRLAKLDVARSGRKVKRAQCLGDVRLGRRTLYNHQGFRITAKRVLEHHRELGVSVRYVRLLGTQGANHVSERAQALVDGLGLLHALTRHARLAYV